MPVQHAVQHASLLAATWLVGKPTRTAGVRKRAEEELAAGGQLGAPPGKQRLDLGLGRRDPKLWAGRGSWPVHLVQRALGHAAGEVVQLDLVAQLDRNSKNTANAAARAVRVAGRPSRSTLPK
jgi:hypothetical protein